MTSLSRCGIFGFCKSKHRWLCAQKVYKLRQTKLSQFLNFLQFWGNERRQKPNIPHPTYFLPTYYLNNVGVNEWVPLYEYLLINCISSVESWIKFKPSWTFGIYTMESTPKCCFVKSTTINTKRVIIWAVFYKKKEYLINNRIYCTWVPSI